MEFDVEYGENFVGHIQKKEENLKIIKRKKQYTIVKLFQMHMLIKLFLNMKQAEDIEYWNQRRIVHIYSEMEYQVTKRYLLDAPRNGKKQNQVLMQEE